MSSSNLRTTEACVPACVVEGQTGGARDIAPFDYAALRKRFKQGYPRGAWMVNNGYDRAMAFDAVASGKANLVAFGRLFISNPDLVRRLREDLPLALLTRDTLYGGGAEGYPDYPALDEATVGEDSVRASGSRARVRRAGSGRPRSDDFGFAHCGTVECDQQSCTHTAQNEPARPTAGLRVRRCGCLSQCEVTGSAVIE